MLDNFTDYSTELQTELQVRIKQYEYYRDKILSFTDASSMEWVSLEAVAKIKNGSGYKNLGEGNYPVYGSGGIMTYVNKYAYNNPSVLIPRKGTLDKIYYVDTPFWNVDTIFYTEIDDRKIVPKFLYYVLVNKHLEQLNQAAGVPSLTQAILNKVKIPLPSKESQERIVYILDAFDSVCNDIKSGLPAEIAARQKQYEYYRDKLLTFKELQK